MAVAAGVGLAYGAYLHFIQPTEEKGEVPFSNPFELETALKFGLLYALVLVISKTAETYTGDIGIYLTSFLSGLPDADAVTLSMAQLSRGDGLSLMTAARAIVIGVMSNTVAKGGIVLAIGSRELRWAILPGFLLMLITGVGIAFVV
jgi:uncharacterized membrane protein (DUF4010 family)